MMVALKMMEGSSRSGEDGGVGYWENVKLIGTVRE